MRMTTFIVGGIVGATAAMYFTRDNRQTFMKAMNQAGNNMSKFMNQKKQSNTQNLDRVEKIINEDPEVKRDVEEILVTNEQVTQTH